MTGMYAASTAKNLGGGLAKLASGPVPGTGADGDAAGGPGGSDSIARRRGVPDGSRSGTRRPGSAAAAAGAGAAGGGAAAGAGAVAAPVMATKEVIGTVKSAGEQIGACRRRDPRRRRRPPPIGEELHRVTGPDRSGCRAIGIG